VAPRIYAPADPDLRGIKTAHGDYVESDLAKRMNRPDLVGGIVEHWLRLASDRPTVVFATGVAHSVAIRNDFRDAGVMAEHIDGTTPADERDAILRGLAEGKVDVVSNAMVLTEGWDCPAASCAVLARPTRQLGLYLQMVGRVLRPAPGKTDALILDHAGAVFQHGFPGDQIHWTLREDARAENLSQRTRSDGKAGGVSTCPECKAVRLAGEPCPACGWRPRVRPQQIEVADGDLAAVDRNRIAKAATPTRDEKIAFHRQLIGLACERGYKTGWASHKYREKFGTWPELRDPPPLPPEPATRAWVKSRAIAWAKVQERVRGAA
jgi:DNA repair protein RadD